MDYALIMAGGAGSRLWPLSRERLPKPALRLYRQESMFQIAVERLAPLFTPEQILVISGAGHAGVLSTQVPAIPPENFILEPEGRGTAPAIALAAIHLYKRDPEARMVILTADHHIGNSMEFQRALAAALEVANNGYLVTLGITPNRPSTEYGYIQQSDQLGTQDGFAVYKTARFVEKPSLAKAENMLAEGGYSWNSGMFVWKVNIILEQFRVCMPGLYETTMRIGDNIGTPGYAQVLASVWPGVQKETIDYGVMETAEKVVVIPVDMEWLDVGNWSSLKSLLPCDEDDNSTLGEAILLDCHDTLVMGGDRLVAAIGLDDLIIVDTPDALLVCHKDRVQDVRRIVAHLKKQGRENLV